MSDCERTCFDCPALKLINRQLENAQTVREVAIAESLHAIDQLAQVDETDENPVPASFTAAREQWDEKNKTIFTPLDAAEATLKDVREQIVEACADGQPKEIRAYWLFGKTLLECASPKAVKLLGRDYTMGPITDN